MWVVEGRGARWAGRRAVVVRGSPQGGDVATLCSRRPVVVARCEVTGVNECNGDVVGVALGPSAYPSFPILPSLSPYLPIPYPPPYGIRLDRRFGGDLRLGVVSQVYP